MGMVLWFYGPGNNYIQVLPTAAPSLLSNLARPYHFDRQFSREVLMAIDIDRPSSARPYHFYRQR